MSSEDGPAPIPGTEAAPIAGRQLVIANAIQENIARCNSWAAPPGLSVPSHNSERLARIGEGRDRKVNVRLGQRRRHLRADARLALRHDGKEEPGHEQSALVEGSASPALGSPRPASPE